MGKKEQEFLSIVNCCMLHRDAIFEKVNHIEGFMLKILDLKNTHAKLQKESEFYIMPNYDEYEKQNLVKGVEYIRSLYKDILCICNEIGIKVFFPKKETIEYKKRIFAIYRIGEQDISALIYFNEKDKDRIKNKLDDLELE